jgi:predicted nucleic acid-binding protein
MNADGPPSFVDTNVLVYAFDASAGEKKPVAEQLIADLWRSGAGCLSVQVLQEFFVTMTGKVPRPLSVGAAAQRVREFTAWRVFAPGPQDVLAAIALQQESKTRFWDAMILHAAVESGCDTVWSEDLNDGQIVRGVQIRNPFRQR